MSTPAESEINNFLVDLFGDNSGVLYAPTKGESAKSFIRYFFNWPQQKNEVIQHMLEANKQKKDVWVAPALLKTNRNAKKTNWLGTQYLYVDFDSGVPQELPAGIPEPSMKIQSSVPGREHWYWKLDKFYTGDQNRDMLESLNKSITYSLGGDTGGWDATQVLRVPGTKHRVKGVLTRTLKRELDSPYSLGTFSSLVTSTPDKKELKKYQEASLPDVTTVLSNPKVKLTQDAYEIFNRRKDEVSDRSITLYKFAADLLEVRPPIFKQDILALLNHLCYKWNKFDDRSDRFDQVQKILQNAWEKHDPHRVDDDPADEYDAEVFRSIPELAEYLIKHPANWIMEGLLPEKQTMQIVGEANIGKTSIAMRMCADILTGQDFLLWKNAKKTKHKIIYAGLDMDEEDANSLLQGIMRTLSPEQLSIFLRGFKISTPDYGIELHDPKVQEFYEQRFAAEGATIVVFDSLKDTGAMEGEDKRKAIFHWFKKTLMRGMGLTVIVLHHTRKRDKDSKVHQTQDDVFGSGMQNADIKASILLYKENPNSPVININQTKVRRAKKKPVFSVKRSDENLSYEIVKEEVDTTEPVSGLGQKYLANPNDNGEILFGKGKDTKNGSEQRSDD